VKSTLRREKGTNVRFSSLGDASFDFLKNDKNNDKNDKDSKEEEGPSLVPLDPDSASLLASSASYENDEGYDADGLFGPLALLAVGLEEDTLAALASLLGDDLGARGVVPSFVASEGMLRGDLCSAFTEALSKGEELSLFRESSCSSSSSSSRAPRSAVERPAVVLSGMSSAEVVAVVSAWRESGNADRHGDVLFCAAVPANWRRRSLKQLVEDIAGDAAEVEGRRS